MWEAVCFLAKFSLHMHRPKTMFARFTQSQEISQLFSRFHHFQINERYEQVSLFRISRNSSLYRIIVSFTMVIKRSPGGESAGGGQLQSTSKSPCVVPA